MGAGGRHPQPGWETGRWLLEACGFARHESKRRSWTWQGQRKTNQQQGTHGRPPARPAASASEDRAEVKGQGGGGPILPAAGAPPGSEAWAGKAAELWEEDSSEKRRGRPPLPAGLASCVLWLWRLDTSMNCKHETAPGPVVPRLLLCSHSPFLLINRLLPAPSTRCPCRRGAGQHQVSLQGGAAPVFLLVCVCRHLCRGA